MKLMNVELEEYPGLSKLWDTFFEGAKKRLANEDFDLAKDIDSFRRMFKSQHGVVVNTCHGIKGEEFDTVICSGLLHGKLPNWNEPDAHNAADKLLYVICSRAKQELYLVSENGWVTGGGNPYEPTTQLLQLDYEYDS